MLRAIVINPILLALAVAVGLLCCHAAAINPHARELTLACIVFVVASQVALAPMIFQQRPTAMNRTQAALIGMMLHLLIGIVLAVAIMLAIRPTAAFAYWTLLFYWTTLFGLAIVFIRVVRSCPASGAKS